MGRRKLYTEFLYESRHNVEDGRIILIWTLKTGWYSKHWIHLAQGTNKWRVFVQVVMNLLVT
jgi:hypothetical protein